MALASSEKILGLHDMRQCCNIHSSWYSLLMTVKIIFWDSDSIHPKPKAGRFVGENRLLCGRSISQQCNTFIGCKPHGRIWSQSANQSHYTCRIIITAVAQQVEHLRRNPQVMGCPTCDRIFFTCLCPLRHTKSEQKYPYLGFSWEGNSNTAQPCQNPYI